MNIPNWLRNLPARAKEWAGKAGRSIKTAASAAFSAVKKEIISLFQSTSRFIKGKWLFAKQVIKAAWEGFKEWANKTVRSIHAWMLSLANSVKKWYTRLKENKEMQKKTDRLLVAGLVIVASLAVFFVMKSAAGAVTEIEIPWKIVGMVIGGVIAIAFLSSVVKNKKSDVKSDIPVGMIITSIIIFTAFNLALWAGMAAVGGEHGKQYFSSEWLLSPAFILLGVIAIAKAFPSHKDNRFGFLAVPIAFFALVAGVTTAWPGFFPKSTARILAAQEARASLSPVQDDRSTHTRIVGEPKGLSDSPAELFNGPAKEAVEAQFYHSDDSIMVAIAACESRFRQFDESGKVLRGKNAPGIADDVGVFQINEGFHRKTAIDLGFEIDNLEGNIAFADHLYRKEGVNPWAASAWCWRDRYEQKPENWSFDRTPRQILAASRGENEVVIVTAPADSSWSEPVHTYGRGLDWTDITGGNPWEMEDDLGNRYKVEGHDKRTTLKRYPKWLKVRSLSEVPVTIVFTRRNPQ